MLQVSNRNRGLWIHPLLTLAALIVLSACNGDVRTDQLPLPDADAMPVATPDQPQMDTPPPSEGASADAAFTIELDNDTLAITEGDAVASVGIRINRDDSPALSIAFDVAGDTPADVDSLLLSLADQEITASENSTTLNLQMPIGPRPIMPQNRVVTITAADANGSEAEASLTVEITPTSRPDIYLLAGQSNMVGFSETGAKQSDPGEPDAPEPRIQQLNVTGNDAENFETAADFTNLDRVAASNPRFIPALDPLHDGFDTRLAGKEASFIGPGLSFAKRALEDTTANIFLVPAAWSDTGFCVRGSNRVPGIGWNATSKTSTALSGTLLHGRAIARTNLAIAETNGILRGILWHQGEADSENATCAALYAENLTELATSLRENIDLDARGAAARGPMANIPFIVGTMSKGADTRGSLVPFNSMKEQVDAAHRTVGTMIPFAGTVNNDDLVPPQYPCGEGSCIHFGASAYREMGVRYYEELIRAIGQ